jgi:hypothetical protein
VNAGADSVDPGIDRFGGKRYMASVAADWDVSDAVRLRLDVEHVRKDVTETPAIVLQPVVGGAIPSCRRRRPRPTSATAGCATTRTPPTRCCAPTCGWRRGWR